MPLITVFTATYNRADLLRRLYESLELQVCRDFEWIVVDDGSIDSTSEMMKALCNEATSFPIRYFEQKHGGKHRAVNLGVEQAEGSWFFIVDSDDYLPRNAISSLMEWIKEAHDEGSIAGVAGLCQYPDGRIIGLRPSLPVYQRYVEASNLERQKLGLLGDKAEAYRTEVLRRFPFPEIDGESFVTERYCWDGIAAAGYKLRWYDEPIYIAEYLEDGLTKSGANSLEGHLNNFGGYCLYVRQSINLWEPTEAVTVFREYNTVCKLMGVPLIKRSHPIHLSTLGYLVRWVLMPTLYLLRLVKRLLK